MLLWPVPIPSLWRKLLTTPNPEGNADLALLGRLGLRTGQPQPRN